jgi:hypothetical protein
MPRRSTVFAFALLLSLTLLPLLTPATAAATDATLDATPDARAAAIAQQVEQTAGKEAWDATAAVRFTFARFRTHYWDKTSGDHRLEGRTRDGATYVILHNLNTRQGVAYKNGEKTTGEEEAALLEMAYGAWINDTYWLLFPFKLQDPGVNLTYAGEATIEGQQYDKLKLTFGAVGLTPGDTYWAYINRDTHRLDRWDYVLESYEEDQAATGWTWGGWKDYGGVLLASERKMVGGDRELPLDDIAVFTTLPASVFSSPAPVELP